ncbi:MAG: biotin transporter BioY, partial [Hyphomicrobiaceae bacterium]|nr:biotin transporter BioY [Hyphomicrobiaceae bacterium]
TSFAGITAIYTPGLVWLSIVYGLNSTTLLFGFWPFIYTDILKMFLITFIVFAFQQLNQQKSINMFNKNL